MTVLAGSFSKVKYSNMDAHDELAALFAQNLTLHQPYPTQYPVKQAPAPAPQPEPIIYSISQHYTHSAHIVHETPQTPEVQQPTAEMILREYGVDPTALSVPQLELFRSAEDEQKMRLIELWRICPPTNTQQSASVAMDSTSVAHEEALAQRRYLEEEESRKRQSVQSITSLDGTPLTPIQTEHGHWQATADTEPYMMSGYEALARKEYEESARMAQQEAIAPPKEVYNHYGSAPSHHFRTCTNPVYNSGPEDWDRIRQQTEYSYGAYMDSSMRW